MPAPDLLAAIYIAAAAAGNAAKLSFGDPAGDPVEQGDGALAEPGGAFVQVDGEDSPMTAFVQGVASYVDGLTGAPVVPRVGDILVTDTSVNPAPPAGWQFADGTGGTPLIADIQPGIRYIIRMP